MDSRRFVPASTLATALALCVLCIGGCDRTSRDLFPFRRAATRADIAAHFHPPATLPSPSSASVRCGAGSFDFETLESALGSYEIVLTKGGTPRNDQVVRTYLTSKAGALLRWNRAFAVASPQFDGFDSQTLKLIGDPRTGAFAIRAIEISDGHDYFFGVDRRSLFLQIDFRAKRSGRGLRWFAAKTNDFDSFCD